MSKVQNQCKIWLKDMFKFYLNFEFKSQRREIPGCSIWVGCPSFEGLHSLDKELTKRATSKTNKVKTDKYADNEDP